jgi:hypothetical protein
MPDLEPARAFPPLASVEDVGEGTRTGHTQCHEACAFDAASRWHHRRLMTIESDQDVLLELIELAVTWPELEYSETRRIAPEQWNRFVESHNWEDPDRVERIFSLACDVAMTATRANRRRPHAPGYHLGQLDAPAPVAGPTASVARREQTGPGTVAVDRGGEPFTQPGADHLDPGPKYGDECGEGWPGRTLARRRC